MCKLHHPVTQERGNHDLCAPEAKAHHTHIIHPWPVHTKEIYTGRSSLSSHISSPGSYLRPTFYENSLTAKTRSLLVQTVSEKKFFKKTEKVSFRDQIKKAANILGNVHERDFSQSSTIALT